MKAGGGREPESIRRIVDRWLKAQRARQRVDSDEIYERWAEVVGAEIAAHTRVVDLKAGVLHIEVDSPPLLHELSTYYRQDLLASLRSVGELQSIRDLRFRAGSF